MGRRLAEGPSVPVPGRPTVPLRVVPPLTLIVDSRSLLIPKEEIIRKLRGRGVGSRSRRQKCFVGEV